MVIGFVSQKGGASKSTLSMNVATALALRGLRVLLVDADPQQSVLDWTAAREAPAQFATMGMPSKDIHRQLQPHIPNYDHVIIDSPPRVDALARGIILTCHLALVPVQPSPLDVWAVSDTVTLIDEGKAFNEKLKAAFVVSRKIVGTAIGRDVVSALSEFSLPLMQSQISQRVVFAEAAARGMGVIEVDPKSAAAAEINALTDEILKLGGQ